MFKIISEPKSENTINLIVIFYKIQFTKEKRNKLKSLQKNCVSLVKGYKCSRADKSYNENC
jgi:hypothetical protein